mmetsp:Transcript_24180/g.59185  ORF Transcript_24180/g.59185 Transcript_24180/m.59185 type:complete len:266 (+) Transcript_24180:1570-2367(+)
MFRHVVKPRLVALVCGNVHDFVGFPQLLGVLVPFGGGNLDLFVLQFASSNVHRRKATGAFVINLKASIHGFFLQGLDNFAGSTIYLVIVMQKVTNESFVVIVNGRVSKVDKVVEVGQQAKLFLARVDVYQSLLLEFISPIVPFSVPTKFRNRCLARGRELPTVELVDIKHCTAALGRHIRDISYSLQIFFNVSTVGFTLFAFVTMLSTIGNILSHFCWNGEASMLSTFHLDKIFHGNGVESFGKFRTTQIEKIGKATVNVLGVSP